MEDNDKKQTLVGLLVAAVVLILAGSLLAWLGEGRKRDFEAKLLEELKASSPNSQVVKTVARGYVDDIHVWTAVEPDGKVAVDTFERRKEGSSDDGHDAFHLLTFLFLRRERLSVRSV